MKKSANKQQDLSVLPLDEDAVWLEDKILLMDYLEKPCALAQENTQSLDSRFPMKMASSCMLIVVDGAVRLGVNLCDHEVTAGSCLVIAAGAIVERVSLDIGSRIVMVSAPASDMDGIAMLNPVMQAELRPPLMEMLMTLSRMLRTIMTDPAFQLGREEAANDCIRLMGRIIGQGVNGQEKTIAKKSRRDEIVSRFLQCVAANYRTHRDLGFYASELGLSLKHMSHVIHEQTGRHPSQWIKDYVILEAKTMLRSGNYTVQQVSDGLNFANQSFFGKYFKEAVGVSPKKWK